MPPFPKPRFSYDYDLRTELQALRSQSGFARSPGVRRTSSSWLPETRSQRSASTTDAQTTTASWPSSALVRRDRPPRRRDDDLEGLRGIQAELPDHYRCRTGLFVALLRPLPERSSGLPR